MNIAVACGVVAGTAVLTGALLVGDSMRESLRRLTFDRLGRIDEVLLAERFFRAELADQLAAEPEFKEYFTKAAPVIILRTSLENADPKSEKRANRVNLLGCDLRFWELGPGQTHQLSRKQIVLNEPLAERLGVDAGDEVLVRLAGVAQIPTESLLGREDETLRSLRLTVSARIPAEGLGRFSLRPSQQLPLNAYVSVAVLQKSLGQPDRVNAILVAGKAADVEPPPGSHNMLQGLLKPTLTDYGIRVERTEQGYFNITSDRMVLEPAVEAEIERALATEEFQPALTYLANKIDTKRALTPGESPGANLDSAGANLGNKRSGIPYSTITAIDFASERPLGPFLALGGKVIEPLADTGDGKKKIVLNKWAADDLGAKVGETIYVSYFEPESMHGESVEQTAEFELAAVVQMAEAAQDPNLTPLVPNVTDVDSLDQWESPFRDFDGTRLRLSEPDGSPGPDERYWNQYKATPKAFVSLSTGRELWKSRFGRTTSIRVRPREGMTVEGLTEKLALAPDAMGFVFQPVKQQGLEASAGTTDFNLLFLGFSFFIIASAVMLVGLLFRLGIDQRAAQLGILVAVGLSRRRIALLLAAEGLVIAAFGGLVGVPAGVGYAALMLLGLRTWWLKAVVTPFVRLDITPRSLLIGFASGVIVAVLAVVWAVWRTRHVAPRQLLAGQTTGATPWIEGRQRHAPKLATGVLIGAVGLAILAPWIGEEIGFFAAGAMVLIATLTMVWIRLRSGTTGAAVTVGYGNLVRMALRNAARNPSRSTLTIGLVAAACFLIVALSAFRLDPKQQVPTLDSGNGGFALVAESDQPIYYDLNTAEGRKELGFSGKALELLAGTRTIALRVKPGDDASCLNLYRPRQPRLLGIPRRLIDRGGFVFAASAATSPEEQENPWRLLEKDLGTDSDGVPLVPTILEKNTATYSLHLSGGVGETYEITDGHGGKILLRIVGLLGASIFQGDLLISESALLRHFPEVSGYRLFLTEFPGEATPKQTDDVRDALDAVLGDYGLVTETAGVRLARFLAVQNTYLLTFQNLGGLGLLLGTFGLAAVQLRNVLERRGELALLRAAGFRRLVLAEMVMLENGLLLCAGLGCGVLAALVAVLPHLILGGASIPWAWLAGTLGLVLAVGLIAGLAAVRTTLTAPLLAALREE